MHPMNDIHQTSKKYLYLPGGGVHTFNSNPSRQISEFEASRVYKASSRTAQTHRETLSWGQKKN